MNRKGLLGYMMIFIVLLAIASFLVINIGYMREAGGKVGAEKQIGVMQMRLLNLVREGEKALYYIDQSAWLAGQQAVISLAGKGGFHEPKELYLGFSTYAPERSLFPEDIRRELSGEMDLHLNPYLGRYTLQYLPQSNYDYSFAPGYIRGSAQANLHISTVQYSAGVGSPDDTDNQRKACRDAACVAKLADSCAMLYQGMPYVWGGESPYTYEVSLKDQIENPGSVFRGVSLTQYQPAGSKRSGMPTVPGFDCSGLLWWIFVHAGYMDSRLTANGYYEIAEADWQAVCRAEQCTESEILKNAREGDILFVHPCDRGACHVAFYAGGGNIIEAAGDAGVAKRKIPASYYPDGSVRMLGVYRPDYSRSAAAGRQPASGLPEDSTPAYDSPPEEQQISYAVKPSFTASIDYDPGEYTLIREQAETLYEQARSCRMEEACISGLLTGLGWNRDCTDKGLDHFIESYMLCAQSEDNYCLCDIPITGFSDEYTIGFENLGDGVLFRMEDDSYPQATGYPNVDMADDGLLGRARGKEYQFILTLDYSRARATVTGAGETDKFAYNYQTSIPFYKIDNEMVLIKAEERRGSDAPACHPALKTVHKLCAPSKRLFTAEEGALRRVPVEYRFALDFSDSEPPAQPDFTVQDNPDASNSLLIRWAASDPDTHHYNIYAAKREFTSTAGMQPSGRAESDERQFVLSQLRSHDLTQAIADETTYYIAVVAVDTSNNFSPEVRSLPGVSIDDTEQGA